jgi:hypothetical protein
VIKVSASTLSGVAQVENAIYRWTLPSGWAFADTDTALQTVRVLVGDALGEISVSVTNPLLPSAVVTASSSNLVQISAPTPEWEDSVTDFCLNVNYNDSFGLSVKQQNGVSTYLWTVPSELTGSLPSFPGSRSVPVASVGKPGVYPISVQPYTENNVCGSVQNVLRDTIVVGRAILDSLYTLYFSDEGSYYTVYVLYTPDPNLFITADLTYHSNVKTVNNPTYMSDEVTVNKRERPNRTSPYQDNSGYVLAEFEITDSVMGCNYMVSLAKAFDGSGVRDTTIISELQDYGNKSLSVSTSQERSEMRAYPNPVDEILSVETEPGEVAEVSLFEMRGRKLLSDIVEGGKTSRLNVKSLPNGLYVLRVFQGEDVKSTRVQVKH